MTMSRITIATSDVAGILLLASVAVLLPLTNASACHGMSKFRLAPETKSASLTKEDKRTQGLLNVKDKTTFCQDEFGSDASMMDLKLMEGEFSNPEDLQFALNPLFEEDPSAVYYVLEDQQDSAARSDHKFVLAKESNDTLLERDMAHVKRVAGEVYLELRSVDDVATFLDNVHVLCYIPKPKYSTTTSVAVLDSGSSGTHWMVPFFGIVCVGALGFVALQTYKARNVRNRSPFDRVPTEPMGGSYSILSSGGDHDLTLRLAPTLELA
jgi:hypothetical protein